MTQANSYLENEIQTAAPQKLRLMLIDGAIRFARATLAHWESGDADAARGALLRCQTIVAELVRAVRAARADCERIVDRTRRDGPLPPADRSREIDRLITIGRNTTAVYLVALRDLNAAQLHRDAAKIEGVIRILEIERETARLVCEQLPAAPHLDFSPPSAEVISADAEGILASRHARPGSPLEGPTYGGPSATGPSSMSFDA